MVVLKMYADLLVFPDVSNQKCKSLFVLILHKLRLFNMDVESKLFVIIINLYALNITAFSVSKLTDSPILGPIIFKTNKLFVLPTYRMFDFNLYNYYNIDKVFHKLLIRKLN